ncbi:hypothetical protein U0070_025537, partial [Myodes glareolus]
NCITVVSHNMSINKNGDLSWSLLWKEFKSFQREPQPSQWEENGLVKNRIHIVLRGDLKEPPQGTHFLVKSLDNALKLTEQPELSNKVDKPEAVRSRGSHESVRPRQTVTKIMQESESDMVFPEIDLGRYKHLPECPGVLSEVREGKRHYVYKLEVQEKANGRLLSADFKLFCLLLTS